MSDDAQAGLGTLSDLVTPVDEKIAVKKDPNLPYVGLEHIGQRNSQLLGWAQSETSVSVNSVFEAGDVLFGKLRPNLRKCVSAPFSGYCSTDILVLRARNGNDPGFAARVFQTESVGAEAERTSMGTKMPRTSWKGLSQFRVPIPEPKQQSKIAEVLDTLDAAIRGTEAVVAKLRAMKQGLLHDLLTRGIDANGDLRPPHPEAPHLYHQTPLGWLPKEWAVAPLSSVIASLDAGVSVNAEDRPHGLGEIGVLKTSCVSAGEFYPSENKAVWQSEVKRVMEPVLGDTIIVSRMNTPALVGETGYVERPHETLFLPDRLWQLKPKNGSALDMRWLSYIFQHRAYRLYVETYATGTSGTMKNLPKRAFLSMLVGFPPTDEQMVIRNLMLSTDQKLTAEVTLLDKLRLQKSGLMDDLLTGRVPVTPLL